MPRPREDGPLPGPDGIRRLVVVSNRLPVVLSRRPGGHWGSERGSGGLVTALEPVLRRSRGLWIGWPGIEPHELPDVQDLLERESERSGYRLAGISLDADERDGFYLGFSNQVVWPLFHDFQGRCNFDPDFWDAYVSVNRKFATGVAALTREGDFLWIHDYHLMGVAEGLRRRGVERPMGFFLHIPFPPLDLFLALPWRFAILGSLLRYDLIGFQTARDRENFLHVLRSLIPSAELGPDGRVVSVRVGSRIVRVGVFPISIDFAEFADVSETRAVKERAFEVRAALRDPTDASPRQTTMLLGVDRLDYSKGIPHKLRAFRLALRRYPELRGTVSLVQLIVPSREDISEYHEMKAEIDRLVGEIAGEFTRPGWVPVHYQYGRWDRAELIAHYRAARVALVTPLKDGMNLVAKEFCAANSECNGVLVLSEHTGAAAQLRGDAILVNPYDVEGLARAIHRACTMDEAERREHMGRLRERIRTQDIHWWTESFLGAVRSDTTDDDTSWTRYTPPLPEGFLDSL